MAKIDIIATIANVFSGDALYAVVRNAQVLGVNYFRFNLCKYYTTSDIKIRATEILEMQKRYSVKVMIDVPFPYLKPRIFLRELDVAHTPSLNAHDLVTISTTPGSQIFTDCEQMLDLSVDERVFYDDGVDIWTVIEVGEDYVVFKSEYGCKLYDSKSINFGRLIRSDQMQQHIDIINYVCPNSVALSFVSSAGDVLAFSDGLDRKIEVISKIETAIAVDNIDEIASCSSLMAGRGDLMLYANYRHLYNYQNKIIEAANKFDRNVYVATGILPSLYLRNIPTQAELIDISKLIECNPTGIVLNTGVVPHKLKLAMDIIDTIKELKYKS